MSPNVRDMVAQLDYWSSPVDPQPLEGGITNTNFVVDDLGERFVVRVGQDIPIHGVMRFNEIAAARAAYAAGISPEIVYSTDGVFVMRYIEGRTLTESEVREQRNLERILDLIQVCHHEVPLHFQGPALVFWPFHVCRDYIRTARRGKSRMIDMLPRFSDMTAELEKSVGKIRLVFGHNDLLAANFIDDGRRMWLLDWDYAGYNSAMFDLANLSSNNVLTPAQEDWMLAAYHQQPVTDRLRQRLAAMKCVSLLRETLWSIVSEIHSTLDFDYEDYTAKNITRLDSAYQSFRQMV